MSAERRYPITLPGLPVTLDLSAEEVRRYLESREWKGSPDPASPGIAERLRITIVRVAACEERAPLDVARDILARRPGAAPPVEPTVCGKHDAATGSAIGWQVWCPGCNPTLHRAAPVELDVEAIEARDAAFGDGEHEPAVVVAVDRAALIREVRRLRAANTDLHRRAQQAEGIVARSGIVDGRPQSGHGLGRALANYAASQAERKLEAWRAFAGAQTKHVLVLLSGATGKEYADAADGAGVAWLKVKEADPEGAKEQTP